MEPLSTFFRISPSLLYKNASSPQGSQTSSSFSSPSFAEHQTGLKVYRDSPPSFTSTHRVVDDNPLFEGFPALSVSKGGQNAPEGHKAAGPHAADLDNPAKVQEHLHRILALLQGVDDADGKPHGVAIPRLADELEAVMRQLKQDGHGAERVGKEAPPGCQQRAKTEVALTGAVAAIEQLHSTPTSSRSTVGATINGGSSWGAAQQSDEPAGFGRPSESSFLWPVASRSNSSSGGTAITAASGRIALRDSVCKQLLQSPASTVSPLSCVGPITVACGPLFTVDDANMASPKELPAEQLLKSRDREPLPNQGSTPYGALTDDGCQREQSLFVAGSPAMPATASSTPTFAAPESQQAPLFNWMQSMLADSSKQGTPDCPGAEAVATTSPDQEQSPTQYGTAQPRVDPLAAAVHAALAASPSPQLAFGSPLHLKIQRLLAERRTLSMLQHAGIQDDESASAGASGQTGSASPGPVWFTNAAAAVSPGESQYMTDSTSSCATPLIGTQGGITPLPFRSSISPFGPTLRERYASKAPSGGVAAPEGPCMQAAAATTEPPNSCATSPSPSTIRFNEGSPDAAELVAQLGLDLQLDPAVVGSVSELDVLEHVERWTCQQHTVVNGAATADAEVGMSDIPSVDSTPRAAIDMAVQTDPSPRSPASPNPQPAKLTPATRDAAVGTAPAPWASKQAVITGTPRKEVGDCASDDDDLADDVFSPARSDQSKRSPVGSIAKRYETSRFAGKQSPATTPGSAAKRGAGLAPCEGKHRSTFDGTPARRGLFRDADSARALAAANRSAMYQNGAGAKTEDAQCRLVATTAEAAAAVNTGDVICSVQAPPQPRLSNAGNQASDELEGHLRERNFTIRTSIPPATRMVPHLLPKPAAPLPNPQAAPRRAGLGGGSVEVAPEPSRDQSRKGRARVAASSEVEAMPDVLFTPGNSMPGGSRGASSKHMSRIFPTSSMRTESSGDDSESVCGVPRMLSSISSVSIVTSERGARVELRQATTPRSKPRSPSARKARQHSMRTSLTRPLLGFLVSLTRCTRAPEAY